MISIPQLAKKYGSTPDFLLIVSFVLKKSKEDLLTHPEYKINFIQKLKIAFWCWQRSRGLPLAYITRRKEFFGLDFFVNKHVLVPRPETELLVEEAITELKFKGPDSLNFDSILIDVGTGSGCIPIAIAKNTTDPLKIFATDISHSALRVAKRNAKTHNVAINFLQGNLLKPITRRGVLQYAPTTQNIIITANLPYLTQKQFAEEKSIQHEPRIALIGDTKNGLFIYKKLLQQIQTVVGNAYMRSLHVFFEIDPAQSTAITTLIKKYLPAAHIEIKTDLAGRDRVIKMYLPKN